MRSRRCYGVTLAALARAKTNKRGIYRVHACVYTRRRGSGARFVASETPRSAARLRAAMPPARLCDACSYADYTRASQRDAPE